MDKPEYTQLGRTNLIGLFVQYQLIIQNNLEIFSFNFLGITPYLQLLLHNFVNCGICFESPLVKINDILDSNSVP